MKTDSLDELRIMGVDEHDPRLVAARDATVTADALAAARAAWSGMRDADDTERRAVSARVARTWVARLLTIADDSVLTRHVAELPIAQQPVGEGWRSVRSITTKVDVSTGLRVLDGAELTVEMTSTGAHHVDNLATIAFVGRGVRISDRGALVAYMAERAAHGL